MHIEATKTFIRLYKKLPDDIKERTKKAVELLESGPSHPSLGHKKMAGQEDILKLEFQKTTVLPTKEFKILPIYAR